jgi:hypothetical protein
VKIQVEVFWAVKSCSVVVRYQPLKRFIGFRGWYPTTKLQGITIQRISGEGDVDGTSLRVVFTEKNLDIFVNSL